MGDNVSRPVRKGDANRITRDYFDSLLVEMRHIDGVLPSTELKLYGETFKTPVMTAALSHLGRVHEGGMVEYARGAAAAGAVMWAGMGDEAELEAIIATGAKTIKIIKPYADNGDVFRKIEHAERCGAIAVGMDIDHAFNKRGQYDVVLERDMRPKTLDDIRAFVEATKLPFIIKGVLSVKDAEKCLEAGVKGMVISHHHGIQEFGIPPLMVLPKIASVVGGRMPIFVDCGVASGYDVYKALALGATAVSVGRELMGPLGEGGAEGVKKRINEMTEELAGTMARTACGDLSFIDDSVIWRT